METAENALKNLFYDNLERLFETILSYDIRIIVEDFNNRCENVLIEMVKYRGIVLIS